MERTHDGGQFLVVLNKCTEKKKYYIGLKSFQIHFNSPSLYSPVNRPFNLAIVSLHFFGAFFNSSKCLNEIYPKGEIPIMEFFSESKMAASTFYYIVNICKHVNVSICVEERNI